MPLATFGDYQLLHVISTSGSGVTFRARRHGELCVVQIGDPVRAASPTFRDRWETRVEAALDRAVPGLADVTGAGWRGDLPWVASSGEGWTLGEIVRTCVATETELDKALVVQAGIEVARALDRLHQNVAPMLHGRVSPDHVLIQEDGTALVLGLGFSDIDLLRGWPLPDDNEALAAIAPELFLQANISGRVDVYGVALTILSACAGTNPLTNESVEGTREAVLAGADFDADDPDLGAGLGAVLHVSLATDPMQRPERPQDLATRLERVLRGLGGTPDPMDWTLLLDELFPDGPEGYRTEPGLMGRPTTRRVLTTILAPSARATPTRPPEPPRRPAAEEQGEERVVASWSPVPERTNPPEPSRPAMSPFAQRVANAAGVTAKAAPRPATADPIAVTEPPSPTPVGAPRAVPPPTSSALHTRAFARRPLNTLVDPVAPMSQRMDAIRAPREGPPAPGEPPLPPEAPPIPNEDGPVSLDMDFIDDVGPESSEEHRPRVPAPPPKAPVRPAWEDALQATPRARDTEVDSTTLEEPSAPLVIASSSAAHQASWSADEDLRQRVVVPDLPPPPPPAAARSVASEDVVVLADPQERVRPRTGAPRAAPVSAPAYEPGVPSGRLADAPTETVTAEVAEDAAVLASLPPEMALPLPTAPAPASAPAAAAPPTAPRDADGPRIPWIFVGGMAILVGVIVGVWVGMREPTTESAAKPADGSSLPQVEATAPIRPSSLESLVAEREGESVLLRGVVSPDAAIVTDTVTGGQNGRRARHLLKIPGGVSKVGHKRVALDSTLATAYVIQRDGNVVTISVDVAPENVTTATFSTDGTTFTLALRPAGAVVPGAAPEAPGAEEASEP